MSEINQVGVIGASSLVGEGLLPMLEKSEWQVHAFTRQQQNVSKGIELPSEIRWISLGTHSEQNVSIPYWVCLAPIWVLPEYLSWIRESGAKHIVALSSTSRFTKTDSTDPAEQALAQRFVAGEEHLAGWAEANRIAWTILRPTLIYGLGRDKNISEIARLIRRFGFFPLLGKSQGLRQPIHLDDLASACIAAFDCPAAINRAFNVSGGEVLTYREMVCRIFAALGKQPRFLEAPLWLFRVMVTGMRLLPPFRNWSPAMAERMNRDMIFDHEQAKQALHFTPRIFTLGPQDLPR